MFPCRNKNQQKEIQGKCRYRIRSMQKDPSDSDIRLAIDESYSLHPSHRIDLGTIETETCLFMIHVLSYIVSHVGRKGERGMEA
eukprot:584657-Hanusia_phi.AAC.2